MTFRLALRTLVAQPIRTAVLTVGFGLGVGAMAGLLGVGQVILEQSRAPALAGGGDLVLHGYEGRVTSARFLVSEVLASEPFAERVRVAAPSLEKTVYLYDDRGTMPLRARGGIPSRERALGDPETSDVAAWVDADRDRDWIEPAPGEVLAAMDRFHPIPDVPARADSWAEWLYFNGRAGESGFYLTFLVGPRTSPGKRAAGVRLQLERGGETRVFGARDEIDESALTDPGLRIGGNEVRIEGRRYRILLALQGERGVGLSGEISLSATAGRSLPPFEIQGAAGWVTGYVVPVLTGELAGSLSVEGERVSFEGGTGYHDHNWGFWEDVRWRWGQVAGEGLSIVYGRIEPPPDAADPERIPGFLAVLGPEGPLGFSMDVVIEERPREGSDGPAEITVRAKGERIDLTLEGRVAETLRNPLRGGLLAGSGTFLQMRVDFQVSGSAGDQALDFEARGSAETFLREAAPSPAARPVAQAQRKL